MLAPDSRDEFRRYRTLIPVLARRWQPCWRAWPECQNVRFILFVPAKSLCDPHRNWLTTSIIIR